MPAKVICTIEEYYQKNKEGSVFYPSPSMPFLEKKKYLMENVAEL